MLLHSFSNFIRPNKAGMRSLTSSLVTSIPAANFLLASYSDLKLLKMNALYVQDLIARVSVPNILLKRFSKLMTAAGKTETAGISFKVEDLGLRNINMKYVVVAP
jgi:hypothetical protein